MKRYWTRWQGGRQRRTQAFRDFIKSESAGGLVLFAASAVALILANSALAPGYFAALKTYVGPLSVLHWINDALMAVFFLLVGLEIKREFVEGQLATWPRRLLPGIAAAGGMAVPAAIFFFFNTDNGQTLRGWAIPTATDIAFALGVLALLGPRVPISLKVFLTAVAIIDDLGAVAIIAAFYTSDLSLPWLGLAVATLVLLAGANRIGIKALWPYLAAGAVLWVFVLKSGVHATLAGVALAMVIPLRGASGQEEHEHGPLHTLEHRLHAWVAFLIVPVFGFANAGVALGGVTLASLLAPLPLGIAAGLFLGKQIGVFLAVWAATKLRIAHRPEGATWAQVYGVSLLCGIGFTMSLFIGLLAFPSSVELQDEVKIGVLAGSLLSGAVGALVLFAAGSPKRARRQSAT